MQQDIREKLRDFKEDNVKLSANHANKFEALLANEIHQKKPKRNNLRWLSIAATIALLVSLGIQFYTKDKVDLSSDINKNSAQKEISLGSISPEFQTIESYYVNSINLEISQLDLNDENKEIIDGYLVKIGELSKEYKSLTKELNTKGVNDATIDALIRNLQLRLQLLKRLKKQLKQLKNLNTIQNETDII